MIQISLWVQPVGLGGFQQGKDRGVGIGTGLGVAEEPVLSTDDNRRIAFSTWLLLISISPWLRNAQRNSRWFRE